MIAAPSAPGPTSENTVVGAIRRAAEEHVEGGWRAVCADPRTHGLDELRGDDWEVVALALALCPDPTTAAVGLADEVAAWLDAFGGADRPTWPPACARSAVYAGWTDPMDAAIFAEMAEAAGAPAESVFDALWDPCTEEPMRFAGQVAAVALAAGTVDARSLLAAV